MTVFRTWLGLLAATFLMFAGPALANDVAPAGGQIPELERRIAEHESAPQSATPNPAEEMPYLLAMAKLASLYVQADRMQESWPLSEKILATLERLYGPDDPNIVNTMEAVASNYGLQGRHAEAEKLRKHAIAINERAFGSDSLNTAISLQGMANLFSLQERYDEALSFAARALSIAERTLAADDPQRAIFLSQVASIHMSAKRYDQAEPLLKQALGIVETSKGADPMLAGMQTIQYLQSLGLSYYFRGRHVEAQPYIDRAISISTTIFGPDHTMTRAMLMTLALQLADQDRLDEAERLYKQALPMNERIGKSPAMLSENYTGLGLVSFKRKDWRNAYTLLLKASTISAALEKIAVTDSSSPAGNRMTPHADIFLINAAAAYRTAEAEPGDLPALRDQAFQLAQRAERSQVAGALAQMAARIGAGSGGLGQLVRERQDLANEWQRLDKGVEKALIRPQAQRNEADENSIRKRMIEIADRLETVDALIARDFPQFAKLSDPEPLSIEEVQGLLGPHEVLIFVANRLNQSLVWAIGHNTADWQLVPLGDEELTREVSALRCGLDETAWQPDDGKVCAGMTGHAWQPGMPLPFDLGRAHRLYQSVFGPFGAMTRGADLIVATSGPLAALPLHVLVTDAPSSDVPANTAGYAAAAWFAKRNAIANLPSVASLKTLRASAKASSASRPYFGIANPMLVGPDAGFADAARITRDNRTCAATNHNAQGAALRRLARSRAVPPPLSKGSLVSAEFIRAQVPLPETADEVCAVAHDFRAGEADIRLAERATETEVKRLSDSGELARYRIVHFATHGALAGQVAGASEPGLLLTPPSASTALDDGYLTASEITGLKLDADWVILSACNTAGGGRAGAEALSGLARAFFFAQARSVLASHWEVDSHATVQLITTAAAAIRRDPRLGRAEALRRAMASLINAGATGGGHPSFWAPFVLVGEGGSER